MNRIIQILFCLCLINCSSDIDTNGDTEKTLSFETILDSPDFFENENLITTTLRTEEEEQAFLSQTPRNSYWTNLGGPFFREFPEVDYQENMVIGILLGVRGIGNTKIQIDSIKQVSNILKVHSTEILPYIQEDIVGYPTIMVELEQHNFPIEFQPIIFMEEDEITE